MGERVSQGGVAEAFLHPSVGRNGRRETIARRIDWTAVERVLGGLRPGRMGPPAYPALMMFKALLLQQWYGLSDPGLEESLERPDVVATVRRHVRSRCSGITDAVAVPSGPGQCRLDHPVFEVAELQLEDQGPIF